MHIFIISSLLVLCPLPLLVPFLKNNLLPLFSSHSLTVSSRFSRTLHLPHTLSLLLHFLLFSHSFVEKKEECVLFVDPGDDERVCESERVVEKREGNKRTFSSGEHVFEEKQKEKVTVLIFCRLFSPKILKIWFSTKKFIFSIFRIFLVQKFWKFNFYIFSRKIFSSAKFLYFSNLTPNSYSPSFSTLS